MPHDSFVSRCCWTALPVNAELADDDRVRFDDHPTPPVRRCPPTRTVGKPTLALDGRFPSHVGHTEWKFFAME